MSKVVVVTGASSGVGRASAEEFARRGDRVALIARGAQGLEAAAKDVERLGGTPLACPADVADADAIEGCAQRIEDELGPIDVWVNNAMTSVFAPVEQITAEEFRRVTEVTYLGVVHGTLSALRRMRLRDAGVIVQVGSALAYRAIPLQSAYCAAKHAARGFTDSLRTELMHDGSSIGLTTVHLPALNTPQFEIVRAKLPRQPQPVPPIYQPEVAARAIVWASEHPERRELLVGMPTVATVLANRLAPGLLDRYLAAKGYESQQTDEPLPDRPDNLFSPVPGDPGSHGLFDAIARSVSPALWLSEHRRAVASVAGAGAAAVTALVRRAARRD